MSRFLKLAAAALLTLQLFLFEAAVINGARFATSPFVRWALATVVALVFLIAIASLAGLLHTRRAFQLSAIVAAALITLRFYTPAVFGALDPRDEPKDRLAADTAPNLVAFLRKLSAAEEQYRLIAHTYSIAPAQLDRWVEQPPGTRLDIVAHGDTGWFARVSHSDTSCTIWVRDARLRQRTSDVEGSPVCGAADVRTGQHRIQTVLATLRERGFKAGDIRGQWIEHRADARRSAVAEAPSDSGSYNWTIQIGGPIRGSAAIAGNQVFVGAHANGEIVALSLDSGKVGYRMRAPNWVHHEPAVFGDVAVFGFGNNEPSDVNPAFVGSPPSGVVAYDRFSGREKWRRYTRGSVMGSPVISNDIVAASTGGREAIAWRLADGAVLWRTPLEEFAPMANPLIVDSLLIVGVEPAQVCAIVLRSGRKVYCHVLDSMGKGAGHSSAAIAEDLVLQVYEEDLDGSSGGRDSRAMAMIRHVVGLPPRRYHARPPDALREQVMVALKWRDGSEAWRVRLGQGRRASPGHNAGTPVVAGNLAFVPSPVSQTISAVDVQTGRMRWSARVKPSRGSVLVIGNSVIAATEDTGLVVLDSESGQVRCRQPLPQVADRAGPAVSGGTGVLTLSGGMVLARPLTSWLACRA